MELMLPFKHVTERDKRALTLYFAIALVSAACVVFAILYKANFQVRKTVETEQSPSPTSTPTPKATPRNRQ